MKKRILSLFLAAMLLCMLFAGCGLGDVANKIFGGKVIAKVDGYEITEEVYSSMLLIADAMFQQEFGMSFAGDLDTEITEGQTGADLIRERADALIVELESARILAKRNGISLSDEDKKKIEEQKQKQIDGMGGKQAFLDEIKASGYTETSFDYLMENQYLTSLVYEKLFLEGGKLAPSTADITANLVNNYVRVKHVLVLCDEGAANEAEKLAIAKDVAKRARAGEEFESLIETLGEDPGMTSNPDGYLLDKNGATPDGGSMVKEFSEASNALAVDGVSDPIRTSYGFHIIKRYPLTEEYIASNSARYIDMFAYQKLTSELTKIMQETEIEKTKDYDSFDVKKVFDDYEAARAETGASEGDGHNHQE